MSDNSSSQRLIGLQGGAEVFHRYRFTANKTNTTRTVSLTDIPLLQTRQTGLVQFLSQISLYRKQDKNDSYSFFQGYRFTVKKTNTTRTVSFADIALLQTRQKQLVQVYHRYRFTANKANMTRTVYFTNIALLQTRKKRLIQVFHTYRFTATSQTGLVQFLSQISLYCKQDKNDSYSSFTNITLLQNSQTRPTCSEKLSPCNSFTNVFLFCLK